MSHDLTHASFFSGVGGTDLGLESAGWRTVSFSEIDPYASAVLAERWPGVPNLGNIVALAGGTGGRGLRGPDLHDGRSGDARGEPDERPPDDAGWQSATLWSGGFPCQDLSVAGKRAGFGLSHPGRPSDGQGAERAGDSDRSGVHAGRDGGAGSDDGGRFDTDTRSGLAFAFLDLVERHRPPAVLLENVPGLLSSHAGRDFGALQGRMVELGYGVAYRILDARHFGVPQRRRRVFILALRCEADDPDGRIAAERAAAVLSVGTRCDRHLATGVEAGPGVAERTTVGAIPAGTHGFPDGVQEFMQGHFRVQPQLGASPDPGGVRATDGLAGRLDGDTVGPILSNAQGGNRTTDLNIPLAFVKRGRAQTSEDSESWGEGDVMPTLNSFDVGDTRTTAAIVEGGGDLFPTLRGFGHGWQGQHNSDLGKVAPITGTIGPDDPLLPLGLDSHRYRCCGNGVVAPVAEWIGMRLREALA